MIHNHNYRKSGSFTYIILTRTPRIVGPLSPPHQCVTMESVKLRKEVDLMSRRCEICQKGLRTGFQVSHSHIRSKRSWQANIQKVRAVIDGETKRVSVCSRCLRSGKVQRAQ